jgi:thymidylate synthase (FAD)
VLQELARHRIASYTVRSTRYTLGTVLNTFIASQITSDKLKFFIDRMIALDYLVIEDEKYQEIEWKAVYEKLLLQQEMLGHEFIKMILSKNGIEIYNRYHEGFPMQLLRKLESTKQKRNIGDNFKHIVTENWKTSLVMTMNLRSFKNFYKLRSSNAAWFQIRWLANEMFEKLPIKYKLLIDKKLRNEYEN